jgi:KDO2-lipid IV(A) lauroyltransferase
VAAPASGRRRWFRRARHRFVAAVARVLTAILERLPFGLLRGCARLVGAPLLFLLSGRRAAVNLHRAFGDSMPAAARRRIVWRMSLHFADAAAEMLAARRGRAFLAARLDDADARARAIELRATHPGGVIGLTGHVGNWELVAQWCQLVIGPVTVVARRISNPKLNALIERYREAQGVATAYRDDPPSTLLRVLRGGGILGIVPDQDIPKVGGIFVDFLGRPAYTPTGPARLALGAGVPIAVVAIVRARGRLVLRWLGTLLPDQDAPRDAEVRRLTEGWSRLLEQAVRDHPEQWPWFHDRWKTTPEELERRGRERTGSPAARSDAG